MKDPRDLPDELFEPIRRRKQHGHHLAKKKRHHLPRCNGKNSYWTREAAESTRSTLLALGSATYLNIYRCPICVYWHLTHQKPRKRHA